MANTFLCIAAALGFTATTIGAFAAHALRGKLPADSMRVVETAVHYQFWHALALLAVGALLLQTQGSRLLLASGWLFTAGTLLFCGSLYLLGMTMLRQLGPIPIGPITPVGGTCLLAGWLLLGIAAWRMA